MAEIKDCGLCGETLSMRFFTLDARTSDGQSNYCINCQELAKDNPGGMTDDFMNPCSRPEVLCYKCKVFKLREEFTPDARRNNGAYPWCKVCWNTYQRDYRQSKSLRPPRLKEIMPVILKAEFGDDSTPGSILKSYAGQHAALMTRLYDLFADYNPRTVRGVFIELAYRSLKRGESDSGLQQPV